MNSALQRFKAFIKACEFAAWSWPISHLPSYRLRHGYLRRVLAYRIVPSASIHTGCHVTGFQLSIGPHSVINRDCRIDARGGLIIGANVSISTQCYLISSGHDPQSPSFEGLTGKSSIEIEDYAWLGPGSSFSQGCESDGRLWSERVRW